MRQIGQVYIHSFNVDCAEQTELFHLMMRESDTPSRLAGQTNGFATDKREYTGGVLSMALNRVLSTTEMLLNELSGATKPLRYWFVGIEDAGRILLHDHAQSDWAAVFYPLSVAQDHGGAIVFEDGTIIRPDAGMLVMFPGALRHKVRPYTGSTTRLSVAFNRDVPTSGSV